MSKAQIQALVAGVHDALFLLAEADPALKSEVYADLGVELTYDPTRRKIVIEGRPTCATERVGGGT